MDTRQQIDEMLDQGVTVSHSIFNVRCEGDDVVIDLNERGDSMLRTLGYTTAWLDAEMAAGVSDPVQWVIDTAAKLEREYGIARLEQMRKGAHRLINRRHILPGGVVSLQDPPKRKRNRSGYLLS